jgi:osmotically-inducible protein OsmY
MNLNTRSRSLVSALTLTVALTLSACGPKDADTQTAAMAAVSAMPGISVTVVDGVATIAGQFADAGQKSSAEAAVQAVKGVKSVVDNATVPAPVVISADDSLRTNVATALSAYGTLSSQVQDGVVTLAGSIGKAELPKVMQALSALHPKKIDNKATITK